MIVTIDDYRGAVQKTNNSNEPPPEDDHQFTVASAGRLKLRLQALNDALTRTPPGQHLQLPFDEIINSTSSRTYVDGSEEVYFMLKNFPGPNSIAGVFIKAYGEVLRQRPYMSAYIIRQHHEPHAHKTMSERFAPTFSDIRPMLCGLDAVCHTSLSRFFEEAEKKGMLRSCYPSLLRLIFTKSPVSHS